MLLFAVLRGGVDMKKLLIAAIVLVLAVSCSTRLPYSDAGLVGNVIEKDYEVLGPVSVSGKVHNVLGFIQWGGFGYNDILEKARELYPETDAVINITQDVKNFSVAFFYNSFGMDFSGLAIKYIDGPAEKFTVDVNMQSENDA